MRSLSQVFATISRFFAGALFRTPFASEPINRRTCNVEPPDGSHLSCKAAKAPLFQACPKAAKASRHTWYVGTGPKHTRTASQPPWDPLGHITPAAKSLPHEGEGLRTQRQVRTVRWLHVTRSSVDRLTRKARESAPAKNRLMVAKACESDLILEA